MSFEPHNYTHGWKAVFAVQILAPRFGGLEAVTNALDFFQRIGYLSSDGASLTRSGTDQAKSLKTDLLCGFCVILQTRCFDQLATNCTMLKVLIY